MILKSLLIALSALSVIIGIHGYLWWRLVRDVSAAGGRYRRIGTACVVLLPVTTVSAFIAQFSGAPFTVQRILAWPGFLWVALMLYLTLALLAGEVLRPMVRYGLDRRDRVAGAGRPATVTAEPMPRPTRAVAGDERADASGARTPVGGAVAAPAGPLAEVGGARSPSRRLFVARTVAAAAGAVAVGTVGYGAYGVFRGPSVKRVTVSLSKLPRRGHGFRIAVVSDIHLGPILGRAHTQRVVDAINGTGADLIAVVGDLVDGRVEDLGTAAEPLAHLRSRHGAYFVTGNHEYYSGAEEWLERIEELGMRPLRNARDELPAFDLVGVNDVSGAEEGDAPDFAKALGDRDPTRASVLLAHQPVQVHDAVRHGVDLQLSGHSHGGQLWPGPYVAALANPTVAGLERYGDTQLYVTRGAGAWGPPVRVGAESDITVVELSSERA